MQLLDIGFGGKRYRVPYEAYSQNASVRLPDGNIVHCTWEFVNDKPRFVVARITTEQGKIVEAIEEPNKNYLTGRYPFRHNAVCYNVSQEVYPDAYIELPAPHAETLLVTDWGTGLPETPFICQVEVVAEPDDRPRVKAIYANPADIPG